MKRILNLLVITMLATSVSFAQLISYEFLEEYDRAYLMEQADMLGILPGIIKYNYDLKVYKVLYQMEGANGTLTQASGALVVPQEASCGLPIASYQHGTIVKKTDVPSHLSNELVIGLLYATNGYILSMPDYQGLGDSPGLHPYVHAASEARAVTGLLQSTQQLSDSLDFSLNDQLFLFGYSQGGHATMAAHRFIQDEMVGDLEVTASSPMSGPYDVSGAQAEVIVSNNVYPTPNYLPYILLAYQEAYGNLFSNPSDIFKAPYDTLLPPLFDGTYSGGEIDQVMPSVPNQVLRPDVLDSFRNDPNHRLRVVLRDNDVYDWTPQVPMRLIYCTGDDQVSFQNSIVAYDRFIANGATGVEKVDFGNLDHGGCASFAFISGLAYFNTFREENNGINVDDVQIEDSNGSDGEIAVTASGGIGALSYLWSNGATTPTINGLSAGTYTLILSDANGCALTLEYRVDMLSSTHGLSGVEPIGIFPNPASEEVRLSLPMGVELGELRISDLRGRHIEVPFTVQQEGAILQIQELPAGIYFLEVRAATKRYVGKLLVK